MKLTVAALFLGLFCLPALAGARTKKPVFKIDTLKVDLRPKYDSALNRGRISRNVKGKLLKMKRCFVAVVRKDPKYNGFLWLSATFDSNGKITQKSITTTVKNAVAMKCMEWMVDFWKLPRGIVGRVNAQVRITAR